VPAARDAFDTLDAGAVFGAHAEFDRRGTLAAACLAHTVFARFMLAAAFLAIVSRVVSGDLDGALLAYLAILVGGAGVRLLGFRVRREALFLGTNWRGSLWELSWIVCALFSGLERRKAVVEACLRPLFEAFVCGCWRLYWADDTLYWVAK